MSDSFEEYLRLRTELGYVRWLSLGEESSEEDSLLDAMDELWWDLTDGQRQEIEAMDPIPVFSNLKAVRRRGTIVLVDRHLDQSSASASEKGHRSLQEVA